MFGLVTFLLLIAALAWGTWRKPAVALAAVLCLYGLKQWGQSTSVFLTQHRTIANFAVAAIVALGLARMKLGLQRRDWVVSSGGKLGIALYLYAAFSLAWTPSQDVALSQWALHLPYILTVAVLAPLLFTEVDDVKIACYWTVIIGGAICVLALTLGNWGARGLLIASNAIDMETNPLALASLGGTVLIMALLTIPTSAPNTIKMLFVPLVLVGMAIILRSGSRGQLLAALGAALVGWQLASKRQHVGTVLVVVIVGGILATAGFWLYESLGVDSSRWSTEQSSDDVTGRFALAFTLLGHAIENPLTLLFGVGNSGSFHYIGGYPHVAVLEVVAEEGLIGAALYACILIGGIQSIRNLRRHAQREDAGNVRYVVGTLTALFLFEWTLTLKQGTLLSSVYFVAYAGILGRLRLWQPIENKKIHKDSSANPISYKFLNLMR